MRLFCGIRRIGNVLRVTVLDRDGREVLRCEVPLDGGGKEGVRGILDSIETAYGARLLVASAEWDFEPCFREPWEWRVVANSALYGTPLARDESHEESDPYWEPVVLAALGALGERGEDAGRRRCSPLPTAAGVS